MLGRHGSRMGKSLLAVQSHSAEETQRHGAALGRVLRGGDVVALTGDLGAGKTTFVQGVAMGMGWRGRVTSPTFTLINEYALNGELRILHVDGYRLEGGAEAAALGLEELLGSEETITIIEWPERMRDLLPFDMLEISFVEGDGGEESRRLTVRGGGPRSAGRLAEWMAAMENQGEA